MTSTPSWRFRETLRALDLIAESRKNRHQKNLLRLRNLIEAAESQGDAPPVEPHQSGFSPDLMLRAAVHNDGRGGSFRNWPRLNGAGWRRRAVQRLAESDRGGR